MAKRKDKVRTVVVSIDTWKKLAQAKLDDNKSSYDVLIKEMLKDRGY